LFEKKYPDFLNVLLKIPLNKDISYNIFVSIIRQDKSIQPAAEKSCIKPACQGSRRQSPALSLPARNRKIKRGVKSSKRLGLRQ
jgi:hypothetical protein